MIRSTLIRSITEVPGCSCHLVVVITPGIAGTVGTDSTTMLSDTAIFMIHSFMVAGASMLLIPTSDIVRLLTFPEGMVMEVMATISIIQIIITEVPTKIISRYFPIMDLITVPVEVDQSQLPLRHRLNHPAQLVI